MRPLTLPSSALFSRARLAGLALLALAGCADVNAPRDAFAPPCPQRAILAEAGDLARYTPGGKDLTDLVLQARVTSMNGVCTKGPKPTLTRVSIIVGINASRGPAARSREADISYFVAVLRGDDILNKEVIPVHIAFPSNASAVAIQGDEVTIDLPTPKGVTAADYRVLVGLQLSPEELAHNRAAGT
jgi:hypothetical protein